MDSPGRAHAATSRSAPPNGATHQVQPHRVPRTPRPTDSPGRAHAAVSPQRPVQRSNPPGPTPIGLPPTPPSNAPRPGGQRRRLPPAAAGGIRENPFFARTCAGHKTPLSPRVPASPARFGLHPLNLGWATGQSDSPTPPRHRPSARSVNLPGPSQISYSRTWVTNGSVPAHRTVLTKFTRVAKVSSTP